MTHRILLAGHHDDRFINMFFALQSWGYDCDRAGNPVKVMELLQSGQYDLLCVYDAEWFDGKHVLRFIQEYDHFIPILVFCDREKKNEFLELGATDVLSPSDSVEDLKVRVRHLLAQASRFEQAFRDPLTGAYNRRCFEKQIQAEHQLCQAKNIPVCLCFLDIDFFKNINDTYGHSTGDQVLTGFIRFLQRFFDGQAELFRYGGEEFVLILRGTAKEAYRIVSNILQTIRQEPVAEPDIYITFSAGICEWSEGMSVSEWVRAADEAAYEAKRQGRNCVIIANQVSKVKNVLFVGHPERRYLEHLPVHIIETDTELGVFDMLSQHDISAVVFFADETDQLFQLVEKMKREHPKVPVIICTKDPSAEGAVHSLRLGIERYLVNPDDLDLDIAISPYLF